jgi:hypothetical protein
MPYKPLSLSELSKRETSVKNLTSAMKTASYSYSYLGLNEIKAGIPFTYGSELLEQFIGRTGIEPLPSPSFYNQQVNQIGKIRVEELTRYKANEILKDIRTVSNDYQTYPYSSLFKHNHYAPNLNSTTWKGVSQLLMQSDEYVMARGLFQNRLVNHINTFGGTLFDSYYTDDPTRQKNGYPNIDQWISQRWMTQEGRQGNFFGDNGPAFTAGQLKYDLYADGDANTEDRDLGLFFGDTELGIGYIKGLSYYDVGNGSLFYTANVEFYWFDGFNFDVKDRLNPIDFVRESFDLQQHGWGTPFTTSIRIDDTISGYMPRSQNKFWGESNTIIQPKSGIENSRRSDIFTGTNENDGLIGRSGNDRLVGGKGDDILSGGKGEDTFVLTNQGYDQIIDFNGFEGDILEVSASAFGGGLTPGFFLKADQIRSEVGATQATTLAHRFIYNIGNGSLWFDRDGIGNQFIPIPVAGLGNQALISSYNIKVIS